MKPSYYCYGWCAVESRSKPIRWYVELPGNGTAIWFFACMIGFDSIFDTCLDRLI